MKRLIYEVELNIGLNVWNSSHSCVIFSNGYWLVVGDLVDIYYGRYFFDFIFCFYFL